MSDSNNLYSHSQLATLDEDGSPPESRMSDALACRSLVQNMVFADQPRGKKRSLVKGLIDGNPPYRTSNLIKAGRADACNVNWRTAEAYFNSATGAFYDIFSESETYATVELEGETPEAAANYSGTATEEFQRLLKGDDTWDYTIQMSQYNMVLYGCGPLIFEDSIDWRNKHVDNSNLLVMERTKSDAERWECCAIISEYYPHELYEMVMNEDSAAKVGWDVAAVKEAIINASPMTRQGGQYLNWEWHEQMLKNQSLSYSAQSLIIRVAHFYYKEFKKPGEYCGKISHRMVLLSPETDGDSTFLYSKIGKYETWRNVIHPMYYDHSGGGHHHSVTGMGVKMYSAMEYQNRLLCNLADKAFAPKTMFKPTTANDKQKLSVAHFGDYGVMPAGFDVQPMPIGSYMPDLLAFNREVKGMVSSNLSQYSQNLQKEDGNPITATETNWRASEQAKLGKTQMARYYEQMDWLYAEKWNRAINPDLTKNSPGGEAALEFQKRCIERGIPRKYLSDPIRVSAARVVGQGSMFQRQQSLMKMMGIVSMFPETGRSNLINDVVSAECGQSSVNRYNPKAQVFTLPSDQESEAMNKVAGMKVGIPPTVTATQNPLIYAQTFLKAASDAAASLEKGGHPLDVLAFLELAGPGALAQLQRMANDPSRKQAFQALMGQWKQLSQMTDQLKQHIIDAQKHAQQNAAVDQQAQAVEQGQDPKTRLMFAEAQNRMKLDQAQVQNKIQLGTMKEKAALQRKQEAHAQDMALADAATATDIQLKKSKEMATNGT